MNIQPLAASLAKLEERSAPAAPSGAGSAPAAATGTPPSREAVAGAVKAINDAMLSSSQGLEFSIDDDTKGIVVKVIDVNTREVVRQMPSEEALAIAKSIDKMQGLLIRQTA